MSVYNILAVDTNVTLFRSSSSCLVKGKEDFSIKYVNITACHTISDTADNDTYYITFKRINCPPDDGIKLGASMILILVILQLFLI
jgi:hypothetical protein